MRQALRPVVSWRRARTRPGVEDIDGKVLTRERKDPVFSAFLY
jgi:hypothetical protein